MEPRHDVTRRPGRTRYLLLFALYFGVFFALDFTPFVQRNIVSPWTDLLATVCGGLLATVHPHVVVVKNSIIDDASRIGVTVLAGCNAVEACGLLVAAMLSFPTRWKERISGAVVGTLAVQALNALRIISLFFLAGWNQAAFDFAHQYLWQALIMLDVLVAWLFWIRRLARAGLIQSSGESRAVS